MDRIFLPFGPDAAFYGISLASGCLCFCAALSGQTKTAFQKWALSIPFTLLFGLLLSATSFSVRLVNQMIPGYGNLSAGGGFALMFSLLFLSFAQGAAILLSAALSGSHVNRFPRLRFAVQDILLPAICLGILAAVFYLERTMPSYHSIYVSVYG